MNDNHKFDGDIDRYMREENKKIGIALMKFLLGSYAVLMIAAGAYYLFLTGGIQ